MRSFAQRRLRGGNRRFFAVLESTQLASAATLHLVKAGSRYFVLSAAKDVRLLSEVQPDEIRASTIDQK